MLKANWIISARFGVKIKKIKRWAPTSSKYGYLVTPVNGQKSNGVTEVINPTYRGPITPCIMILGAYLAPRHLAAPPVQPSPELPGYDEKLIMKYEKKT